MTVLLRFAVAKVFSTKIAAITLKRPTLTKTAVSVKSTAYGQPNRFTTSKKIGRPSAVEQSPATEHRNIVNNARDKEENDSTPAFSTPDCPMLSCMSMATMYSGNAIRAKLHAKVLTPPVAPFTIITSSEKKLRRHTRKIRATRVSRSTRNALNLTATWSSTSPSMAFIRSSRKDSTTRTNSKSRHRKSVSLNTAQRPRSPKKNARMPRQRMTKSNSSAK
mmetsp:Transcript_36513/g.105026  ORF Transcript_36513/g.105026 Transcript_36513/m.105026 type:complete len:220 (+) Transcript_36513:386-1045(+)